MLPLNGFARKKCRQATFSVVRAQTSVAVTRESVPVDTTNTAGSEPSSYVPVPLSRIEPRLLDSLVYIEENRNTLLLVDLMCRYLVTTYVCVCVYASMYVYMYACMHVCLSVSVSEAQMVSASEDKTPSPSCPSPLGSLRTLRPTMLVHPILIVFRKASVLG